MTNPTSSAVDREQCLNEILLTFVEAEEQGQAPNRREYLAAHPEYAAELAEFLTDRDRLERLAAPFRGPRRPGSFAGRLSGGRAAGTTDLPLFALEPKPGFPESAPAGPVPRLGQLGDFLLLREVGRGGMGTVYEAEQISLNRRVALKVLPFAAALDKQLQRFKNEAQAAALLHHPHIVPVYAVGCERGLHYYAMQFIEGQSLAALIQELSPSGNRKKPEPAAGDNGPVLAGPKIPTNTTQKSPANNGSEKETGEPPAAATFFHVSSQTASPLAVAISTERCARKPHYARRVAHLGLKAAEALEHAHQMGVVHRDIKPGNLLLDGRGELWITDFGLALLRNNACLTTTGELVGTLRYMSPEQASAQRDLVDHRTDIYSLGVTLYELLTLRPLFESNDSRELLHHIAFEEPRPPRAVDRTIPVELETIILKAIAKIPGERYASAQELADDLQRFLQDQPVRARRPTLLDRARKWSRRHKPVVVSAVVLLFAAVAGLLTSTVLIARAHSEVKAAYQREQLKADEALRERERAEANYNQARKALDFLTRVSSEELVDESDVLEARRKLLGAALDYHEEFIDQHQDEPSIQADLAVSKANVAKILDDLGAQQEYHQQIFQVRVLRDGDVQKHLGITPAQGERIWRLFFQVHGAFAKIRQVPETERGKKARAMALANEKALEKILSADQVKRLNQIALQLRGPLAFGEPEVARILQLTPDQKTRIQGIQEKGRQRLWGSNHWARDPKKVPQIWLQTRKDILAILTAKQQNDWKALTGEPFRGQNTVRVAGLTFSARDARSRFENYRQKGHDKKGQHKSPFPQRNGPPLGRDGRSP